ncbi:multidrug effflux MFS transporter [Pseudoduganella sp. GCM10020061]|uniref:multidrug effflux MFS transporter n=1 Tax=Pseudoduganella sp. GCM10020061 TaxID=3317345 RepID=UPI00362E6884
MVGALAIDTYLPAIPAIGKEFQVGPLAVQQTLSLFLFAFAFMMLFYGTLSDSFGRRRVLLAALSVYTVASIGAAFAPTFGFLLGCRVLQGLSAGAGSVLSAAIVQDRFSGAQAQRMMSHIMMVFGLAPAIAPVLGGYLHMAFGWRSTFVFLFLFGLAMIVLCYRTLPESLPPEKRHAFHPGTIARNYLMVLKRGKFVLLSLTLGMAFGGLSLYIGSAANFVMGILGKSETGFAWLFIPLIGGMMVGSALSGKFAARYAPVRLVQAGFVLMGISGLASVAYNSAFVAETPWAVLPLAVYTFGLSIAMPAIQVKALSLFPDNRGLAASMQAFIQMMSFALVSGFLAPLLFDSALKLAYGLAATLVLSFLCWTLAVGRK